MQLLRLNSLPRNDLPPVALTVGNFDGVHLGHQAMIYQLKAQAERHGLKTMVMLFEPQPLEYFRGADAPPRLSSWREKVELLRELGVDYVVTARFNEAFRNMSAARFTTLLTDQLNVRAMVVGDDFRFGCDRTGDQNSLKQAGIDVETLKTVLAEGERVSSTRVREALALGDFRLAEQLLGRPYSISGRVQHGDRLGRTLDFPTANIGLKRLKPALHGIYAAEAEFSPPLPADASGIRWGNGLLGATHVGTRPAIQQEIPQWRLETFLPDFSGDLYGKRMKVTFRQLVHGERNYDSLEQLKAGIDEDVRQIRQIAQAAPVADKAVPE